MKETLSKNSLTQFFQAVSESEDEELDMEEASQTLPHPSNMNRSKWDIIFFNFKIMEF